jgi:hypothetical protein
MRACAAPMLLIICFGLSRMRTACPLAQECKILLTR